jgi:hypothetical protein
MMISTTTCILLIAASNLVAAQTPAGSNAGTATITDAGPNPGTATITDAGPNPGTAATAGSNGFATDAGPNPGTAATNGFDTVAGTGGPGTSAGPYGSGTAAGTGGPGTSAGPYGSGTAAGTGGSATGAPTGSNLGSETTAGNNGYGDAGATLPAKCTDEACCQKIESNKQPCTSCTNVEGCTFFGLFNNNVFSAGGKCLLSTTAEAPTGHKEVKQVTECADLCDDIECDKCLTITGCVWCDTGKAIGDKVGIDTSTGSCELAKCNSGVAASTVCPSSAATNALGALAAVVAFVATAL